MSQQFVSYRTASVASDHEILSPSVQYVTTEVPSAATYKPVSVSPMPFSSLQYATNGAAVEGNVVYETVRYLVPMERRVAPESYLVVNKAPQLMSGHVQMSPVYVRKVPSYSLNSVEESESIHSYEHSDEKTPSVFSQSPTPVKSPEPFVKEVDVTVENSSRVLLGSAAVPEMKITRVEVEDQEKLDTRFFGELLAEVYRKNCDIHSYISENVSKIRGRKHLLDPSIDYKVEKDETEALIPKGVSELTKQQIRYLLQTRSTADKTMRLLLTTFNSLREELLHLQEDLRRLESEKEGLEKDLSFKVDQATQYNHLLQTMRENNRQLQVSLKESNMAQRSLEMQMESGRGSDSNRDYRIKELEGSLRALEQENGMLKQKLAGQGSVSSSQVKTEELSKQYNDMLSSLREEKDKEIQILRSQLLKVKTEYSTTTNGDRSLELRIRELLTKLEQREILIRQQEEEIRRLQQERSDRSKNVTKTVKTKTYGNQYPILGLLSDEYQYTPPVGQTKTVVIERTEK